MMFKKIFSMFQSQAPYVGANEIVTRSLTTTPDLFCHLVGDVTIVVGAQHKEANVVMNICPGLLEKLKITDDKIELKSSIFQSIMEVNDSIIINNVVYPRPTFLIHIDHVDYIFLDGLAHYKVEYKDTSADLEIVLEGSCDYDMNIHAKDVDMYINTVGNTRGTIHATKGRIDHDGTGDVFVDGSLRDGVFSIDGTGKFDGSELMIQEGILEVSSMGNVDICIDRIEYAMIDSMGNVTVNTSTPEKLHQEGMGKLRINTMVHHGITTSSMDSSF